MLSSSSRRDGGRLMQLCSLDRVAHSRWDRGCAATAAIALLQEHFCAERQAGSKPECIEAKKLM